MLDCVIIAGGVPQPEDLLYPYTQGTPKACIHLAGKPMGQWVVDAFAAAQHIEHLVIVGLTPDQGIVSPAITAYVPDQGSLLDNIIAGIERMSALTPGLSYVLVSTVDIPLITGAMIDSLVRRWEAVRMGTAADIYYHVVPRTLMEQRFPGSNRSYVHLVEGDFAGADMHIFAPRLVYAYRALWESLLSNRKSAFKQAKRLGLDFFIKLFTRRLSISDLEKRIPERLDLRVKVIPVTHAEIGMDVDKPFQLEICEQELKRQLG